MDNDSGTALLWQVLTLVSGWHLLFAEIASLELQILTNWWQVFGEKDAFSLKACVIDRVAEQETTFFVGVAMQVEKSVQLLSRILDDRLNSEACGLELQIR